MHSDFSLARLYLVFALSLTGHLQMKSTLFPIPSSLLPFPLLRISVGLSYERMNSELTDRGGRRQIVGRSVGLPSSPISPRGPPPPQPFAWWWRRRPLRSRMETSVGVGRLGILILVVFLGPKKEVQTKVSGLNPYVQISLRIMTDIS